MASSWDKLGQAASVMQVTGVDALGLVSMIVQAAHTARHNRDRCQLLAQHVETVGGLLRKLDIPELRRHPETRRPLEQLDAALFGAYKLVRSCSQYQENRSQLYQMFTGADVASKLRLAQEEIDRYINLIPMITLVAVLDARGTQEDVTVDRALAQRPRLSLQEVNESLALEELPTTGLPVNMESRRNGWHLMIDNVRSLAGWRLITYQVAPETHLPRGIRSFSYNELCHATNKFSDKEKLGEGGNGGFIYRGFLKDEAFHVAVERIDASRCGYDVELRTQLKIFSEIRHHSLVKLVGWCNKADQLFLVYELATNGFLDTHLQDSRNMLKWPIRYRIILGIGSALLYLHREIADIAIVHRDISPRNMMLDSSLDVKLLYCPWRGLIGTMGYIDLIRIIADSAGAESDVYSFGVVLLEIACGRRPIFSLEDQTKVHLVNWVWELYGKDALLDAADPRLNSDFEVHEMKLRLRPSINEAMNVLGHFEAPLPNLPLVMPEFRQR